MIRSVILCLLAVSTALAFPADSTGAPSSGGGCPGGYAEGNEIERGRLIFVCQGGQVVPKGCIAEDLSRLSVGGNFDKKDYRMKCQLGSDGQLSYAASGCVQNGAEHKVDETWDDSTNFYTCKADGDALKVINQGCVDGGKHVNAKDKVTKDDGLYSCEETVNGGHKLIQAGCVKDGKQVNAGDTFESGKFWYNCTRTGREKVVAKPAGCLQGGKRLNDGDRAADNGVFYECRIDADKQELLAIACDQDGVERRLGCTWVEGSAPLQYEWTCKHDAAGNSAVKEQVRCNYKVGDGVYQIEPGCYRIIEKAAFGCVATGKTLNLQSFQGGEKPEAAAEGAGLHAC